MTRWSELIGAFMLLTRLPVGGLCALPAPVRACLWAYPLVGLVVGGVGALVLRGAALAGLAAGAGPVLALAAMMLVTGALHEDGLADTADGFGGGGSAARKLEIMRDSRIGSYGALASLVVTALRGVAVAGSAHPALSLVLAGMLGRGAMLLPLVVLRPARADGLAAGLGGPGSGALAGLALTVVGGLFAPAALVWAAVLAGGMVWLMRRQVGGYTGDTLGATEQLAECAALLAG